MSEVISGKDALIALANGEEVQFCDHMGVWHNAGIHTHAIGLFLNDCYEFRLKPRTITINGIEVPSPFEPKHGDKYYVIHPCNESGWMDDIWCEVEFNKTWIQFGAWRTEEEIIQVVAALRSVFGKK